MVGLHYGLMPANSCNGKPRLGNKVVGEQVLVQNLNGPEVALGKGEAGRSKSGIGGTCVERIGAAIRRVPGGIASRLSRVGFRSLFGGRGEELFGDGRRQKRPRSQPDQDEKCRNRVHGIADYMGGGL